MSKRITRTRTVRKRAKTTNNTGTTIIPPTRYSGVPDMENNPVTRIIWRGPVLRGHRPTEWLHVSDLIHKCVRKKALSQRLYTPLGAQEIWDGQGITFAMGEAIGSFIVNKLKEMDGRLFGDWACGCREPNVLNNVLQTFAESQICNQCGNPHINYLEFVVRNEALRIVGHADFALNWNDKLYLGEVKSVNENGAQRVESQPDRDHVIQLLFYWWLAKQNGTDVHDTGSVLYVSKFWKIGSPYIEHTIDFREMEHLLEPFLVEARDYAAFLDSGSLPERRVCDDMSDSFAADCEFAHECFAEA